MKSITVDLAQQTLTLFDNGAAVDEWLVSTAVRGAGEQNGSYQTPRGRHIIRAKIGAGQPIGTVFRARRPTGEVYTPQLARAAPRRDWILTRILWLSGCEVGVNRLGNTDTMRRYIYIHGTPDTTPLGQTGSIGCIRMDNRAIIRLFDAVPAYTPVLIR